MVLGDVSTGEKIALGGGSLTLAGSLLPWVSANVVGGPGIDGGREIAVLLCSLVLFGLLVLQEWEKPAKLATGALGVVVLGIAGYSAAEAFGVVGNVDGTAGIGLYLSLVGAILLLVGAYQGYVDRTPEAGMYSHRR